MRTGSEEAAQQAERIANLIRERGHSHGDAVGQHEALAGLWTDYLTRQHGVDLDLKAEDAMYMLLLLKVSRIASAGLKEEHVEDIAGYAALTLAAQMRNHPDVIAARMRAKETLTEAMRGALELDPISRRYVTPEELAEAGPFYGGGASE